MQHTGHSYAPPVPRRCVLSCGHSAPRGNPGFVRAFTDRSAACPNYAYKFDTKIPIYPLLPLSVAVVIQISRRSRFFFSSIFRSVSLDIGEEFVKILLLLLLLLLLYFDKFWQIFYFYLLDLFFCYRFIFISSNFFFFIVF